MVPGDASLEENGVGRAQGAVRRKLNGGALDKGAGCHNHLIVVPGHGPGLRGHKAVHRCGHLNALAEGLQPFRAVQVDGLDDVVPGRSRRRVDGKAQPLIEAGGKNGTLLRPGGDRGGQEEALVEGRVHAQSLAVYHKTIQRVLAFG